MNSPLSAATNHSKFNPAAVDAQVKKEQGGRESGGSVGTTIEGWHREGGEGGRERSEVAFGRPGEHGRLRLDDRRTG